MAYAFVGSNPTPSTKSLILKDFNRSLFICYNLTKSKQEQANPFEAHGYHPGLMDVAAQALKRGHNGYGEAVYVTLEGGSDIIELGPEDRKTIAHMVDHAVGVESARTVGYGVLGVILPKLNQETGL